MGDLPAEAWIITRRRPITRYEVDPTMAPLLHVDRRIGVTASCPLGHAMPFEVTGDEHVVRAVREIGVKVACEQCAMNYKLDLGEWPSPFPDAATAE